MGIICLCMVFSYFMVTASIKEVMYDIEKSNLIHLKSSLKILVLHIVILSSIIAIGICYVIFLRR